MRQQAPRRGAWLAVVSPRVAQPCAAAAALGVGRVRHGRHPVDGGACVLVRHLCPQGSSTVSNQRFAPAGLCRIDMMISRWRGVSMGKVPGFVVRARGAPSACARTERTPAGQILPQGVHAGGAWPVLAPHLARMQVTELPPDPDLSPSCSTCTRPARPRAVPWLAT